MDDRYMCEGKYKTDLGAGRENLDWIHGTENTEQ